MQAGFDEVFKGLTAASTVLASLAKRPFPTYSDHKQVIEPEWKTHEQLWNYYYGFKNSSLDIKKILPAW